MEYLDRVREAVERCKAGEGLIKWHAPHFVQLQPERSTHVNFFGSPLHPLPKGLGSPAHTHDFGFTSHILSGCIFNAIISAAPTPRGELVKVHISEVDWPCPIVFTPTEERYTILRTETKSYRPGDVYEMDPRLYHSTRFDEPTITILDMWDHAPLDYSTIVPPEIAKQLKGSDRRVPEEQLPAFWAQVHACFDHAGIKL